jgi:hypothetical protein
MMLVSMHATLCRLLRLEVRFRGPTHEGVSIRLFLAQSCGANANFQNHSVQLRLLSALHHNISGIRSILIDLILIEYRFIAGHLVESTLAGDIRQPAVYVSAWSRRKGKIKYMQSLTTLRHCPPLFLFQYPRHFRQDLSCVRKSLVGFCLPVALLLQPKL